MRHPFSIDPTLGRPAAMVLLCLAMAWPGASAQTPGEVYQIAVRNLTACGTFFDQQGAALARGDAVFMRGRCMDRWIAARGALVPLPALPSETVQSALVLATDGSIYLSGGRHYFGDPRTTGVDARPTAAVYQWVIGTAAWRAMPSLAIARARHVSIGLPDGRILAIGGEGAPESGLPRPVLNSVESLKSTVAAASWQPAPALNEARAAPAVVVTGDGDVIVIGGDRDGVSLASAEVLGHGERAWRLLAPLREARRGQTATQLPDGRILVIGGIDASNKFIDRAEIWAPGASPLGMWSSAGQVPGGPRAHHSATLLADGRVLVVGGEAGEGQAGMRTTATWNPRDGIWRADAELPEAPYRHGAFLQPDGSVVLVSASPLERIYNTASTLAYRFRLLDNAPAVERLAEQALAKGTLPASNSAWLALTPQSRAQVVDKLLVYTRSDNHMTCRSAWDALGSTASPAPAEVVDRAAAVVGTNPCGSSPDSILLILVNPAEPLSPTAAEQVATYLEARGDKVRLKELARKHTFSLAAISRWIAPDHPRLELAFEWLVDQDTARFDVTLATLARAFESGFEKLRVDDPARFATLAPLHESLSAAIDALPMHELAADDGQPRAIQMKKAALYALGIGAAAGATGVAAETRGEAALQARLVRFIKGEREYLADASDIGTYVPGPGAPVFRLVALGSISSKFGGGFRVLRVVRPPLVTNGHTQSALAWDLVTDETISPEDIAMPLDRRSGYKNIVVKSSAQNCANGRLSLRYDPARQELVGPGFRCMRRAR